VCDHVHASVHVLLIADVFFFQAEDGIRDFHVTGVQTCALPIYALLPTMGGQTALNCALDLERMGVLQKYGVEMIGARADAIDKAETRQRFREAMDKIGLESARSGLAHSVDEAFAVLDRTGLPAIIRPSFTLGGTGGG